MNICFAFYLSGNILSMLSSPTGYTPIVQLFLRALHVPWSFVSLLHGGTTPQSLLTRLPATPSPSSHLFLLRSCQRFLNLVNCKSDNAIPASSEESFATPNITFHNVISKAYQTLHDLSSVSCLFPFTFSIHSAL